LRIDYNFCSQGLRSKLLLSPFNGMNYTKTTKYEALAKDTVYETKLPQIRNVKYSRNSRKASLCREIFDLFIERET
jgi:hypothetical protein